MADESCGVFGTLNGGLDRKRIHRFAVGADAAPQPMTPAEARQALGDPFATLLLLRGVFPRTAQACLDELRKANPRGPLAQQMIFLLGETSQLPPTARVQRAMRFVITCGSDSSGPPAGPDVLISALAPEDRATEVMAWDRKRGGFNFYRAVGSGPTWVFAGNGSAALVDPTQGKGPFESHRSGVLLMKELKLPWLNWHSPTAQISADAFSPAQRQATRRWFAAKEPGGAYTFETAVARPAVERWARARFDTIAAAGRVEDPRRIMEQILATPTANLASSNVESRRAIDARVPVDLPPSFFADVDGFGELGLTGPDFLTVAPAIYARTLKRFSVRLVDGNGFVQRDTDTHFAFAIPERAFEDVVVLREAMRIGLVTRRLGACLLMVDFANPIFSARRAKLLDHTPASATIARRSSGFSGRMATAILTAAASSPAGSPEREFAERWNAGPRFERAFNGLLRGYYRAVRARLKTQAGFDDYWRLADARRLESRRNPVLAEFTLAFPTSDVLRPARRMRVDGKVA